MKSKAIISLYNTPSGLFSWWDQFPQLITSKLNNLDIDHIVFYKAFTKDTSYPKELRRCATNEDLNNLAWLRTTLLPLCKEYRHIIIHTHSHYPPTKLWLLPYLHPNCEWHITEHRIASGRASAIKKALKALMRRFKFYPKHVIGVSKAVTRRSSLSYGSKNISTIYNGVDLKQYINGPREHDLHKLKLLYVGRLDRSKGVFVLMEAFKLLKDQNVPVSLTIVGGGREISELQRLRKEYDLEDAVTFEGYQHDVKVFYKSHDAIVIPTIIQEALSLVAIEARAMGLPVIYANKGGLPEVFVSNEAGVMVDEPTPLLIARAVQKLATDRQLYNELTLRSKRDIEAFSLTTMVDNYIEHYVQSFRNM